MLYENIEPFNVRELSIGVFGVTFLTFEGWVWSMFINWVCVSCCNISLVILFYYR